MKRVGLSLGVVVLLLAIFVRTPGRDPHELEARYGKGSTFVELPSGIRAHVRATGPPNAPVLLLLHGSNASLHTWEPWVEQLQDRFRLARMDFPGHGLTGRSPSEDYSTAGRIRFLEEIREILAIEEWAVAGNSMGGHTAWRYALARPGRTQALILLAPSGVDLNSLPPSAERPSSNVLGFLIARTPGINRIVEWFTPRSIVAQGVRHSWADTSRVNEEMIDRYYDLLLYPGNRRATRLRFGLEEASEPSQLAGIQAPTLILWGEEDQVLPFASADLFAKNIPNAKLISYTGVGHLPMEEHPVQSAEDTASFLVGLGVGVVVGHSSGAQ